MSYDKNNLCFMIFGRSAWLIYFKNHEIKSVEFCPYSEILWGEKAI